MDAQEVELKGKAITAAYAAGDPPASILSLLEELRKGVTASEKLLRDTRIGVAVNKLKQHKDAAVSKRAADLVAKWRLDVKRGASSATGSGSSTPSRAGAGAGAAAANGAAASPAAKARAKFTVPPEKRSAKEDKVDTKQTGNATRDNCLRLMYDGLAFMSEDLPDDVLAVARSVELAAFNALQPETSAAYKDKIRSLYQNLKNKSNPGLRKGVLSGSISPERFVTMSHEELMSPERRAEDEKLMKENMDKAMVAQEEKSISQSLQCGKCGQKKVSYSQAQTRSADEPMTTFCECLNCGRRWKFS
ncbi:MAG: transcription elongation factor S-II [Terriglobus roseus]|nr:transcription elongation factor S-II [Terriglobus roseus]